MLSTNSPTSWDKLAEIVNEKTTSRQKGDHRSYQDFTLLNI